MVESIGRKIAGVFLIIVGLVWLIKADVFSDIVISVVILLFGLLVLGVHNDIIKFLDGPKRK